MPHHEHLYTAWDAAIRDLNAAVEAFRAAIGGTSGTRDEKDIAVLADEVSKRKQAAFEAWVAYADAAGFGRI